jgi:hypothetical protein
MQAGKNSLNDIAVQVRRLRGLPGWPSDDGTELINALTAAAVSLPHATAVIDGALDSCERCPVPVDLRRIANESKPQFATKQRCSVCTGSGWISDGMRLVSFDQHGGTSSERIEPAQEKALRGKLNLNTQAVYEGALPCPNCYVAPQADEPRRRKAR